MRPAHRPTWLVVLVLVACGDDAISTRDTAIADTRFVPTADTIAEAVVDTVVAEDVERDAATADTTTTATALPDVVDDTPVDSAAPDAEDAAPPTETDAAPPDADPPGPEGDDCARPHALADPDQDRHWDALGDIGAAAGLADDLDGRVCDLDDPQVNGEGKVDEVWRFVAPGTGSYLVSVLSDTNIDVHFYVLDAATCGACLGASDTAGAADIDRLVVDLAAGDAVAIVVDGKRSAHAGAYIIDVYACEGVCE